MEAKRRADSIKDAQTNGNKATMAMLGLKHLTNCKVDIVSTNSELTASLAELFYDAGAENVDEKRK